MTQWLFDTLLATSGLFLLVLVLREPVRRRLGASVAYALWLLPAARLAMPPLTRTVERIVPAADTSLDLSALAALPEVEPTLVDQLGGWPVIAIVFWLAVAATMIAAGLLAYRRQRRHVLGQGVQIARLGKIRIVRSEALRGPVAFGLIDKVIAVPADFDHRYDERERRLALDHELAHHAAGDLWANTIAFVLLCLQWFNPLAWAAHAAFRFDQEAACDARVLDKVDGRDRAAYGQAIAKAASGRALLFAGALDRPSTLSRRLNSMLIPSHPSRRRNGQLMIVGAIVAALPLTATWATRYIDIAEAPKAAPAKPIVVAAALQAAAPVAAQPSQTVNKDTVSFGPDSISFIGETDVRINGVTKRWDQLTPAEAKRIRVETAKARAELAKHRRELPQQLAQMQRDLAKFQNGDFDREMAEARKSVSDSLAEIDRNAADMRRAGVDVEKIKAEVRASLAEVSAIDVEKIKREALDGLKSADVEGELKEAEESLRRIDQRLDAIGQ